MSSCSILITKQDLRKYNVEIYILEKVRYYTEYSFRRCRRRIRLNSNYNRI